MNADDRNPDSFPRQYARTQRFTLGLPRSFTVAPDGSRVVFLRSAAGDDPLNAIWVLDVADGTERLVFDPRSEIIDEADLPPEERARRERARERAEGIVAYSTDRDVTTAAFSLGGRLFVADLTAEGARRLSAAEPVFDPRLDPAGTRVAYVSDRSLRVIELDGDDRLVVGEDDPDVAWGVAEFVAAEEMNRPEGFWWSPDGTRLSVARVDESRVTTWHVANPVDPDAEPRKMRYPQTGTDNADVSLHLFGPDGAPTEIRWDRGRFEYLARVLWTEDHPLTLLVQSRDQRTTRVLTVNDDGTTTVVREDTDPAWVELVEGSPAWLDDGRLVSTIDLDDTRRLAIDGEPVTLPGLQVRRIAHAEDSVVFVASDDPLEEHVWRWTADGELKRLTDGAGVHTAVAEADVTVVTSATLEGEPTSTVRKWSDVVATISSNAERPVIEANPTFLVGGDRRLNMSLLTPGGRKPDAPLPVLLDPYGGPWFQRVTRQRDQFLESQWFADQGFAVLVADGRGTPGRGTSWEKAVHHGLLEPALEDQVDALHAAAERFPFLDLDRVAIRGWSFGGHLAAAAVLRRPEIFHAAVAGAPATDETLYDTHYTERYLGRPQDDPELYRRSSLLDDAPNLRAPLLIVHGLADDNVLVANSLRLSRTLLEAGKPHTFLPLSGATHMAKEVAVAENLLLLELRFLRDALGSESADGTPAAGGAGKN